jgi:uncharacterized protein YjlB
VTFGKRVAMTQPETYGFDDAGGIPNSPLPVLVYHDVEGASAASECGELLTTRPTERTTSS